MTAGPGRRGPGSNQYADKPPRPSAPPRNSAGTLRAQAEASVAETGHGGGAGTAQSAELGPGVSLSEFSCLARGLAAHARRHGLRAPSFKTLPIEERRSLRRYPDGTARVSVPARGRQPQAVVDDMVEGVVRANGLQGIEAARKRLALWESIEADGLLGGTSSCR